ncbi:MAG: hypothetical protein WBA12_14180 [Catalinimonas sp.]
MRFFEAPEQDVDTTAAAPPAPPVRSWALWVSVVLHPLLMLTLLFAALFYYVPEVAAPLPLDSLDSLLMLVFLGTALLPTLGILSLRLMRNQVGLTAAAGATRQERLWSVLITAFVYTGVTWALQSLVRLNPLLVLGVASGSVTVALAGLVSYLRPISLHMVGVGGAMGFLAGLIPHLPQGNLLWPLVLFTLLAGLVGTARLARHAHRPPAVFFGWLLGAAVGGSMAFFLA